MYRPRLILQMQILNLTRTLYFSKIVYFFYRKTKLVELTLEGKVTESRVSYDQIKCVIFNHEYIMHHSTKILKMMFLFLFLY